MTTFGGSPRLAEVLSEGRLRLQPRRDICTVPSPPRTVYLSEKQPRHSISQTRIGARREIDMIRSLDDASAEPKCESFSPSWRTTILIASILRRPVQTCALLTSPFLQV